MMHQMFYDNIEKQYAGKYRDMTFAYTNTKAGQRYGEYLRRIK
jgi:hypothetical protein